MSRFLARHLAPISEAAWALLDEEAKRSLRLHLATRQLVDFTGPLGWDTSAIGTGRKESLKKQPMEGVNVFRRQARPLVELRADFRLDLADLHDVDRGAPDPDLKPLAQSAHRIARAEDDVVFNGYPEAGIQGIGESSPHEALAISTDYSKYPVTVSQAVEALRRAQVNGPYAIALGPRCYAGLTQAVGPGGFPVLDRLRHVLDGPIVRAPTVDGAIVLSTRGGDFELVVGQDFSLGYTAHQGTDIDFYLIESMTFRVVTPEAAVALRYEK